MKKKNKFLELKIKRAALFALGLTFFVFPSQSYYATVQATWHQSQVRDFEGVIPLPAAYPINQTGQSLPLLTARSLVVIDRDSAVVMGAKNEKLWLLPASTVKIMTALVVLDYYDLDQVLVVNNVSDFGQDMGLVSGEKITVRSLLYGLLVSSANDAALVLAQNYPGGEPAFVKAMNQKAIDLDLKGSYFANPTGLDSDDQGRRLKDYSYSTALDLAHLSAWALRNPFFDQLISTQQITVTDVSGSIVHPLYNINQLLGRIEGVKGVKTGWTEEARECLVSYVELGEQGVITVVLGSNDRFGETVSLINWVLDSYQWQQLTPTN